jgi:hypothetical protein
MQESDRFCRWPVGLLLLPQKHDVPIVDNVFRRKIDVEFDCESLPKCVQWPNGCGLGEKPLGATSPSTIDVAKHC